MEVHLVLVHGSRLASSQWAPQIPLLRDRVGLTLVDLPGHGSRAGEEFTLERCLEVIDASLPRGVPVVLVGHSLGGYAAMAYAARRVPLSAASCSPTRPPPRPARALRSIAAWRRSPTGSVRSG